MSGRVPRHRRDRRVRERDADGASATQRLVAAGRDVVSSSTSRATASRRRTSSSATSAGEYGALRGHRCLPRVDLLTRSTASTRRSTIRAALARGACRRPESLRSRRTRVIRWPRSRIPTSATALSRVGERARVRRARDSQARSHASLLHVPRGRRLQVWSRRKDERAYLRGKVRDIHESDRAHLRAAEAAYLALRARSIPVRNAWRCLECVEDGRLLTIDEWSSACGSGDGLVCPHPSSDARSRWVLSRDES